MSEQIFLHIGQCGCQVGSRLWKLFGKEHRVSSDGILLSNANDDNYQQNSSAMDVDHTSSTIQPSSNIPALYEECLREENKLKARCLFIDSDPMTIEQVKSDPNISKLIKEEHMIKGQEDCASNFGRGKYIVSREFKGYIEERVRKMVEACDSPSGFVLTHSIEAGTGSGYTSLISTDLQDRYPELTKSTFTVFPSENFKTEVVEPYNSMLALADLSNSATSIFSLENESMYNICKNYGVQAPDFCDVNDVISQTISTFTQPNRFYNSAPTLTRFDKMNFISNTFTKVDSSDSEINAIDLFNDESRMNSINHLTGTCLSLNISLRGADFTPDHLNTFSNQLRELNAPTIDSDNLHQAIYSKSVENISESNGSSACLTFSNYIHLASNTTSIVEPLKQLDIRFQKMFTRRCFVHWYVGEGMEEGEFWESQEQVQRVIDNYSQMQEGNQQQMEEDTVRKPPPRIKL